MMQRVVLKMKHRMTLEDMCSVEDRLEAIAIYVDWDCVSGEMDAVSVEMDAVYVEADVDDELIWDYGMLEREVALEFGYGPDADVTVDDDRTRRLQEELA